MAIARLLLFLGAAIALKQDPGIPIHGADFTISRLSLNENPLPMSKLEITDHVVTLKRGTSKSLSSFWVQKMRKRKDTVYTVARAGVGIYQFKSTN
jgi:hypothetical protein